MERSRASITVAGGLILLMGWEWLWSGLAKLAYGTFPQALIAHASDWLGSPPTPPQWYISMVMAHGVTFGYLVEWGETLVGIAFIVQGILWLRGLAVPARYLQAWRAVMGVLALAAALMPLNFYVAGGVGTWWLPAHNPFDKGLSWDVYSVAVGLFLSGYYFSRLYLAARGRLTAESRVSAATTTRPA